LLYRVLLSIIALSVIIFFSTNIYHSANTIDPEKKTNEPFSGKFNLIDQDGIKISEDFLKDNFTLVYFGFTYCTDICPITLDTIVEAIDALPKINQEKVKVLFVSLDPERDKPETLSSYLLNYQPYVTGATGSHAQIKNAADNFLVIYKKNTIDNKNDYLIGHSGYIYLMDKNGKYVDHFNYDITIEELSQKLNSII